jgi:dephospho-CoA kinase
MKLPDLIGIAGTFGSGKDTLAEVLVAQHGFTHASTSDMVRAAARHWYGSIERPILNKTATRLRQENGGGALVLEALQQPRPLVITGIRSLGEARALKAAGGTLVFVDADPHVRFDRMKARRRDSETALNFQQFMAGEAHEMYSGETDADFNIRGVGEMADVRMDNSGRLDEFIEQALASLEQSTK